MFGLLSLRGAGRALDLLSAWFDGGVPCHVVVQNWIMRLGIYRLRTLKKEIMDYIEEETAGVGDDQILLGSSDIIESVFGRYKGFSGKTPMEEVGRAVLTIPVFTGKLDASAVRNVRTP